MGVETITVFKPTGPLNKVWLMWEVVKKFYRLSDEAHSDKIASLEEQINDWTQAADVTEADLTEERLRGGAMLADEKRLAGLSGDILTRATILHLLTAFVEFAVKQIFTFLLPDNTLPAIPKFERDLINPLKAIGAFTDYPPEYRESVHKYRDAVRNQFAHGDWIELAREVQDLDLTKAFEGTAKLMAHFETNMQRLRPNEYYEVYTAKTLPEEQTSPDPTTWKFLVVLPASARGTESEAMAAARRAFRSELMTNFQSVSCSWAKLVPGVPRKLDPSKCIIGDRFRVIHDECRVWILQKPSESEVSPFV
jgi:hypothetical protein